VNFIGKFLLASALVASASLQAATTYNLDFNSQSNSPGLIYDGNYAISPYSGTVGGTTVQLFCDDFNDNVNWGQQNITAYQTSLTASATTLDGQTRYGDANPSTAGASYPAGTTLYDEMTWLATQMLAVSGTSATYNETAIQEAIWTLTNDKNVNDGSSPHNKTTTQTGTYGDAGVEQSYLAWIADAEADYGGNAAGYASLVTGNWSIVTAVASAGCTVGSGTAYSKYSGVSACTPGAAGTGSVTQEFLAYSGGTPTINQGGLGPSTPEPASFLLIGSGLLAGAVFARRKAGSNS
jgi:hypothetical protein